MRQLKIETIKNNDDFRNLKNEWNRLLDISNVEDITLTWEWLYTWWETFEEKKELWLLVIREEGKVIGIAPLFKQKIRRFGFLSINKVAFLGTGEDEKDEICSDYLDFIIKKGREKEVIENIAHYLISRMKEWDQIWFSDLIENSEVVQNLFKCFQEKQLSIRTMQRNLCPYINLPGKWEDLVKVTKNRKKHIKNKKNLLEKQGSVEYLVWPDNENYEVAFRAMVALHQGRWNAKSKLGCFASEKFTAFHRKIFSLLLPMGRIKLYFLKLNNKYAACQYSLHYKDKMYDYLKGLDSSLPKHISPGFMLLAYSIEDAIALGKRQFDFFKGTKGSYKQWWTDTERSVVTITIFNETGIKNKIVYFINQVVARIKNILKGTKC